MQDLKNDPELLMVQLVQFIFPFWCVIDSEIDDSIKVLSNGDKEARMEEWQFFPNFLCVLTSLRISYFHDFP